MLYNTGDNKYIILLSHVSLDDLTDTFGNPVYEYKWYADSNALTTSTKLDEYGTNLNTLFEEVNKHTKSLSYIDLKIKCFIVKII